MGWELRFERRGGALLDVLLQVTPLRDAFGNITGWVSSVTDITERKRAELRLAAEHAITRILANAQGLEEAAPGIIQVLLDSLEMDVGGLWWLDEKRQHLCCMVMSSRSLAPESKCFVEECRRESFKIGDGVPGEIWRKQQPLLIPDVLADPYCTAEGTGYAGGVAERCGVSQSRPVAISLACWNFLRAAVSNLSLPC